MFPWVLIVSGIAVIAAVFGYSADLAKLVFDLVLAVCMITLIADTAGGRDLFNS